MTKEQFLALRALLAKRYQVIDYLGKAQCIPVSFPKPDRKYSPYQTYLKTWRGFYLAKDGKREYCWVFSTEDIKKHELSSGDYIIVFDPDRTNNIPIDHFSITGIEEHEGNTLVFLKYLKQSEWKYDGVSFTL